MTRLATNADIPTLIEMGRHFVAMTAYRDRVVLQADHLRTVGAGLIADAANSAILVSERAGTVTGMLGVTTYPDVFSGVRVAGELFWWVEPSARGDGLRLLRQAEQWASEHGAAYLQMIAPTEQVERVYTHGGYEAIERTFRKPIVPAWPFRTPGIQVIDDVLPDIEAYRAAVLQGPFQTMVEGVAAFHGIGPAPDDSLPQWVEAHFPGVARTLTFTRQSPAGQLEPHYVHSDRSMGDWTAILYLTENAPPGDGTTFWYDRETGANASETTTIEDYAAEGTAWADQARWVPWYRVPAQLNRLVMFPAPYYHSRSLVENYGTGDTARLIQVVFGGYTDVRRD